MRIDFPTDAEREASIAHILAEGLTERPTLRRALADLWRALGLRGLLFGVGDCVLLALLLTFSAATPLIALFVLRSETAALLYPIAGGAPLPYASLLLLTLWKEEQLGTRELKMTVRYDLRCLTAMRLLLFSGIGVLCALVLATGCALCYQNLLFFAQLFALSLAALFLYVALTLAGLLYLPARWQTALPAVWCGLCALPGWLLDAEQFAALLTGIPLAGAVLLAALTAAAAAAFLRAYLLVERKGDKYAYC